MLERYRPGNLNYIEKEKIFLTLRKLFMMSINAFKDKIYLISPEEGLSESVGRDEDEDEYRFYNSNTKK